MSKLALTSNHQAAKLEMPFFENIVKIKISRSLLLHYQYILLVLLILGTLKAKGIRPSY